MNELTNTGITSELKSYVAGNELHYGIKIVLPFTNEIGEDQGKVDLAINSYLHSIHTELWSEHDFSEITWFPYLEYAKDKVERVSLIVMNLGYKPITAKQVKAIRALWNQTSDAGGKCTIKRMNMSLDILETLLEREK